MPFVMISWLIFVFEGASLFDEVVDEVEVIFSREEGLMFDQILMERNRGVDSTDVELSESSFRYFKGILTVFPFDDQFAMRES